MPHKRDHDTHTLHYFFSVSTYSLHAVVIWQIVSLVNKYNNPSTSFKVSVSIG